MPLQNAAGMTCSKSGASLSWCRRGTCSPCEWSVDLAVSQQTSLPLLQGVLSAPMVALILGRDIFLVVGAFAARAKSLGWRWPGAGEFFRLQPASSAAVPSSNAPAGQHPATAEPQGAQQPHRGDVPSALGGSTGAQTEGKAAEAPAAPFVEPLYISKVRQLV